MKQKDIAVLIGVLFVSVVISIVVSNFMFGGAKYQQQVAVVDKITSDFPVSAVQGPNNQFNSQAFNPAQIVNVGQPNNNPFAASSQQQ